MFASLSKLFYLHTDLLGNKIASTRTGICDLEFTKHSYQGTREREITFLILIKVVDVASSVVSWETCEEDNRDCIFKQIV